MFQPFQGRPSSLLLAASVFQPLSLQPGNPPVQPFGVSPPTFWGPTPHVLCQSFPAPTGKSWLILPVVICLSQRPSIQNPSNQPCTPTFVPSFEGCVLQLHFLFYPTVQMFCLRLLLLIPLMGRSSGTFLPFFKSTTQQKGVFFKQARS